LAVKKTATLAYGRLEKSSRAEALIMREEQTEGLASYSRVQYNATENQWVNVGDSILVAYNQGYASSYIDQLVQTRKQIAEMQDAKLLSGIKDTDIADFDAHIEEKTAEIMAFARGERVGVRFVDLERDLRDILTKRQEFIKSNNRESGDAELNELYDKEREIEIQIESWKREMFAETEGRVSYIFDGYEYFLKPENLSQLTVETVSGMLKSTATPTVPPEEKDKILPSLYRIVTPDEWYTLLVVKERDWGFADGTTIDLSFVGYEDMPFTATIQSVTGDGEQVLVVLRMSEDIGPLINARKVGVVIGGMTEGLMLPSKAIQTTGVQTGVYLEDGQTFIPVEVKGKDDYGQALVMPVEEGALTPGMKVQIR
jgi:hypothetical protein